MAHTSIRALSLLFLAPAVVAGCGGPAGSIRVQVDRSGCSASCSAGASLELVAYRAGGIVVDSCLVGSVEVDLSAGGGSLRSLPLEQGESVTVAAILSCKSTPTCPRCWGSSRVQVQADASHEIDLIEAGGCAVGDQNLAWIRSLGVACD